MAVELLPRAVLRAARWPVETAEAFTWQTPASAAVRCHEEDVANRRPRVTSALHDAVPGIGDSRARRYVLAAKRAIHGGVEPFEEPADDIRATLGRTHPEVLRLLESEREDRVQFAARRSQFRADHDAELRTQRGLLRCVTSEREFRLALTAANSDVASRWDRVRVTPLSERPRARECRLEAAALNYLLRAVGRPMPHGLWSGVAEVGPCDRADAEGLFVEPCEMRHLATVRVHPFAAALDALARQPRYREYAALRLNPTLHANGSDWLYERFVDGRSEWARLESHPVTTAVLEYWGDGEPRRAEQLVGRLADEDTSRAELLWASIRGLIANGVLVCPLSLPTGAQSVWNALTSVAALLEDADRAAWAGAVEEIRSQCGRLSDDLARISPEEFGHRISAIAGVVQDLLDELGVAGVVPGPIVDIDVRLPFRVGWDVGLQRRIADAISGLVRLHGDIGLAPLYRLTALRAIDDVFNRAGTSALLPAIASAAIAYETPAQEAPPDSAAGIFSARLPCDSAVLAEVGRLVDQIERALEPVHDARSHTFAASAAPGPVDAGRAGSLLVTVADDGITLGWGRPQPGLFVSRFADLLAEDEADAEIVVGLRQRLSAGDDGCRVAELVGADPANIEAAVRPAFTTARVDPHGPPADNLAGATCSVGEAGVVIRRPQDDLAIVPVCNSAAAIGSVDPCSGFLFSLAMAEGWEYLSFPFPVSPGEAERWHHLPRLALEDGTVFSAERWTIDAAAVAEMRGAEGAARYLLWRAQMERRGVPDLVYLREGSEPPALARLFPTASPLAVRCLFDSMRDEVTDRLVLSELPAATDALTVFDDRGHYISELAVIWHDEHAGGATP